MMALLKSLIPKTCMGVCHRNYVTIYTACNPRFVKKISAGVGLYGERGV